MDALNMSIYLSIPIKPASVGANPRFGKRIA
jgi:hypothetical protein